MNSWLVAQTHKSSVNLYYLNCDDTMRSTDGVIQEIEGKEISETEPEQRLRKLLARGNLDEAEQFAREHDLSLQPIYEGQASRLWLDIRTNELTVRMFRNENNFINR